MTFDDEGTKQVGFTLKANETWTAPADRIPVGATCTLTETNSASSDGITFVGDNVVDNGDGTATVTPGTEPAIVEVTNAFEAGTVTIDKVVDGDGASLWGAGPFTFDVTCTYRGQALFNGKVVLEPRGTRTLGPYPGGTTCKVTESGTAGATHGDAEPRGRDGHDPADPTKDEITHVTVTATNTFTLTSLDVAKVITGDLTADGASGPFRVSLSCTWLVDGQRVPFDAPGGADRDALGGDGFRASYTTLPSSSACELTEIADGGAQSTSMLAVVSGHHDVDVQHRDRRGPVHDDRTRSGTRHDHQRVRRFGDRRRRGQQGAGPAACRTPARGSLRCSRWASSGWCSDRQPSGSRHVAAPDRALCSVPAVGHSPALSW